MTDLSPPRGSRDFLPQEKLLRDSIVETLRGTFETFGFNPLETPALENYDILASKYAGGAEILKETYTLVDQGKRKLGLRYDLTVPLARVFASQKLALPFKRYQIASVWRDGPIKAGRYREFTQCDVDVIGISSTRQEAELVAIARMAFKKLDLEAFVKVNNRKVLDALLQYCGISGSKLVPSILALDKLEKVGAEGVLKELSAIAGEAAAKETLELFTELEKEKSLALVEGMGLSKEGKEGVAELKEFFSSLEYYGIPDDFVLFSPSLARGLSYYTGMVFEAFLSKQEKSKISSSIAAGGRYDNMIGNFAESKEKIAAVGISFGMDVIAEALKEKASTKEKPLKKTAVKLLVIPFENYAYAISVATDLRKQGVSCLVDLAGKNVSKNIEFASKQGIPFVAFCGKEEEASGKVKLRDLDSGKEELVSIASLLLKLGA